MSVTSADTTKILERPAGDGVRREIAVRVLRGASTGTKVPLPAGRGVIGRSLAADVRIEDETVSQFHLELASDGDEITVVDLGSRNRTSAGTVVIERARVPSGTTLVLGTTEIAVELGAPVVAVRSRRTSFGALVGASPVMREIYAILDKLAPTRLSVLIEGLTGTGKDLAARALHDEGSRKAEPFVAVNCAALPPALAERVFFGEDDGIESRAGIFASAAAGTVLLDHVGDLPLDLQGKLLRAIDQREILPVGASVPRQFDARIISIARNLRELVNQGAFREDLYFRLAQTRVEMPALDDHPEDKRALAMHFLTLGDEAGGARSFAAEALDEIARRTYPGNVRELRNVVERAAAVAEGPAITLPDLAFERVLAASASPSPAPPLVTATAPPSPTEEGTEIEAFKDAKRNVIDDFERNYLVRLLARSGKNVSRAAALAGIERQSLRDLLKRHGLHRGDDDR